MAKSPRVRLSFQITDGPNAGLACSGWRIWTKGEDTYITATPLEDTWKVSLHADDFWASGITKENTLKPDTVLPDGADWMMFQFAPTPFVDGRRNAFMIAVYRSALLAEAVSPKEAVIAVPDHWDAVTLVTVRMTEKDVEPLDSWALVHEPLPLASGRRVWVTKHIEMLDWPEPEKAAVGTIIVPVDPRKDPVTCPGWKVHGVDVA